MDKTPGTGGDPSPHVTPPRIDRAAASRLLAETSLRFFATVEEFLAGQDAKAEAAKAAAKAIKAGEPIAATVAADAGDGHAERDATPPRLAIIAEASLGKTAEILKGIRPLVWQGRRVLYLAPSIPLADDLRERARSGGIAEAHVIRGRGQDDPENPGRRMCLKDDIAGQIAALGYSVTETLCRDKEGRECEHAAGCSYLAQMQANRKGGALLIGAHAYLSIAMELLKEDAIDLLVIDESFWPAMLRNTSVPVDRFKTKRGPNKDHRTYRPAKGGKMAEAQVRYFDDADEFLTVHAKAIAAIKRAEEAQRPLTLADFRDEQLSPGDCRFAAGIEYTRLGSADVHPAMTAKEQREALENAVTREAFALARVWKCLAAELETGRDGEPMSLRLEIGRVNRAGDLENALVMDYSADARFQRTPVLAIDADGDPEILSRFYAGMETVHIAAEWSNVRVRQVTDRTGSKLFFANPANRDRLRGIAHDLADQLRDRIETPDQRPLVIVGKSVEAAWQEAGHLYDYDGGEGRPEAPFFVAHHGNVRGKDGWKNVAACIVAGRIEPSPVELERMGRALFFASETPIGELRPDEAGKVMLPKRAVTMTARDGTTATVSVSYHPDERTHRILQQVREGELSQNIARPRPVHRGPENPCEILVVTNVPLRIVPDTFATWEQVVPDRWRLMEMRGFVPDVSTDVADAHPDLFESAGAVRKAASRAAAKRDETYREAFYRCGHTLPDMMRIEFRREGNRRKRGGFLAARPGDDAETVAQRVREALPDAFDVQLIGSLPDPLEAAVAASDAADDLAAIVAEVEAWGGQIWWRPPLRPAPRRAGGPRPFLLAVAEPPDPGETVPA